MTMAIRFQILAMQMVAYGLTAAENATGGKSNPLMYPFDLKAAVMTLRRPMPCKTSLAGDHKSDLATGQQAHDEDCHPCR